MQQPTWWAPTRRAPMASIHECPYWASTHGDPCWASTLSKEFFKNRKGADRSKRTTLSVCPDVLTIALSFTFWSFCTEKFWYWTLSSQDPQHLREFTSLLKYNPVHANCFDTKDFGGLISFSNFMGLFSLFTTREKTLLSLSHFQVAAGIPPSLSRQVLPMVKAQVWFW
jgi:hypothetical protein